MRTRGRIFLVIAALVTVFLILGVSHDAFQGTNSPELSTRDQWRRRPVLGGERALTGTGIHGARGDVDVHNNMNNNGSVHPKFRNYNAEKPSAVPCLNTEQGIHFITDNRGYTCDREDLDEKHCCNTSRALDRFSCETCDFRCCHVFETCVSCCLGLPEHLLKLGHELDDEGTMPLAIFDECEYRCRTSSRSLRGGNAYKQAKKKHCYEIVELDTAVVRAQTTVLSLPGTAGETCNSVCEKAGQVCYDELLDTVNSCAALETHFPCQGGCTLPANGAKAIYYTAPGYNVQTQVCTPTAKVIDRNYPPSCSATHADYARLCACVSTDYTPT